MNKNSVPLKLREGFNLKNLFFNPARRKPMSGFSHKKRIGLGLGIGLQMGIIYLFTFQQPAKNTPSAAPEPVAIAPAAIPTAPAAKATQFAQRPKKKTQRYSSKSQAPKKTVVQAPKIEPSRAPASQKAYLNSEVRMEQLKSFFNNWGHGGEWEYNLDENSFPTTISAPQVAGLLGKPEIELKFIQEFMSALGYEKEEIQMDKSTKHSGMFIQNVQGFEVYGGFVQLFYNFEEQTLFMLASHIKNIQNPRLDIVVTKEALQKMLQTSYSKINFEDKPEIYLHEDNSSELAWIVTATNAQQKTYRLLLSTLNGSEIDRIPLFIQN